MDYTERMPITGLLVKHTRYVLNGGSTASSTAVVIQDGVQRRADTLILRILGRGCVRIDSPEWWIETKATRLRAMYGVLNLFAYTVPLFHHMPLSLSNILFLLLTRSLLVHPTSPPSRVCHRGRRLAPVRASLSTAMPASTSASLTSHSTTTDEQTLTED